jgi:hypothetical protein
MPAHITYKLSGCKCFEFSFAITQHADATEDDRAKKHDKMLSNETLHACLKFFKRIELVKVTYINFIY